MKKEEYRSVLVEKKVAISYTCDGCGKEYTQNDVPDGTKKETVYGIRKETVLGLKDTDKTDPLRMPDSWHIIDAYHNGWGNDSIDSREENIACSPECYVKLFNEMVDDFEDEDTSVVDDLEIEFAKSLRDYFKSKGL